MAISVKELEIRAAKQVIQVADEELGLNSSQLASAIGVNRRTLYRYKNGENAPSTAVIDQLGKISEIVQLLTEVFTDDEAQFDWLYQSLSILSGKRPIDLIKKGQLDLIISTLSGFQSGAFK
jgi:putative toxin-antitoxin system antitoxin component (TIGR02293 family)